MFFRLILPLPKFQPVFFQCPSILGGTSLSFNRTTVCRSLNCAHLLNISFSYEVLEWIKRSKYKCNSYVIEIYLRNVVVWLEYFLVLSSSYVTSIIVLWITFKWCSILQLASLVMILNHLYQLNSSCQALKIGWR